MDGHALRLRRRRLLAFATAVTGGVVTTRRGEAALSWASSGPGVSGALGPALRRGASGWQANRTGRQAGPGRRRPVPDLRAWASLAAAGAAVAAAAATGPVARRAAAGTASRADYEGKTISDLRAILQERGLSTAGKKAELVARLEEADAAEESSEQAEPAAERAAPTGAGRKVAMAAEPDPKAKEAPAEEAPKAEAPQPPYGSLLPDPHAGKPETIEDEEGYTRYLCLDGQYRRGDPDSIELKPENFSAWLTEWVVAARTGQLEGKPQKTFLPKEPDNPGNPRGTQKIAGREMKSEDVLTKLEPGPDGEPRWKYKGP